MRDDNQLYLRLPRDSAYRFCVSSFNEYTIIWVYRDMVFNLGARGAAVEGLQ